MSKEQNYLLWSDGSTTSFGELSGVEPDGRFLVRNPAYIGFEPFTVEEEDKNGLKKLKTQLRARFAAYIPEAAVIEGENIWQVSPKHNLLTDSKLDASLVEDYKNQLGIKN